MARTKGIIRLKGTVGHITFYKRLGVEVTREAGGPSASQIKKRRSMRRQRENINEFYHAASPAAKVLRVGLAQMKHLWHPDLCGYLNGLFRAIIGAGPGAPGQRSLCVLAHKEMLMGFSFHPERFFENVFMGTHEIEVNTLRNEATLSIPPVDAKALINAPEGATHFRLLFAITVLSEYVFVRNAEPYRAADIKANGQGHFVASEFMDVQSASAAVVLKAALPGGIFPAATSALIAAFGIEFHQEVNGKMYKLKQGGCMRNVEVF